jgi:PAS domain S-box-containing protein
MNYKPRQDQIGDKALYWRQSLPVLLTFCVGFLLSLLLFSLVKVWELEHIRDDFIVIARTQANSLQGGLDRLQEVIGSIAAFYAASQRVERDEFRSFVTTALSQHLEIQALEWVPRVPDDKRSAYERMAREDGWRGFEFTERDTTGRLVRALRRSEYYPVFFVEPFEGNENAFGYDLASDPIRLKAMEKARDSGKMIATSRLSLVQEEAGQYGFLIFQPVYRSNRPRNTVDERRENLAGYALGVFCIEDLIKTVSKDLPGPEIDLLLKDESAPENDQLLYVHRWLNGKEWGNDIEEERITNDSRLRWQGDLNVPGRRWSLTAVPVPAFFEAHGGWQKWGNLLGGLTLTLLSCIYVFTRTTRTIRTEQLAAQLTVVNEELKTEIESRRRVEEALSTREDLYRRLIDTIPHGIEEIDQEGVITFADKTYHDIYGYEDGELIGQSMLMLLAEDSGRDRLREHLKYLVDEQPGPSPWTGKGRRKDESVIDVQVDWNYKRDGNGRVVGFISVISDITKRKAAEEALKESERRFHEVAEHIREVFWLFDTQEQRVIYVSPGYEEVWGRSVKDLYHDYTEWAESIYPEDRSYAEESFGRILLTGGGELREYRIVRPDGTVRWVSDKGFAIRDKEGQIRRIAGIAEDVTVRKETEERLRESEVRYRALFEESPLSLWEFDYTMIKNRLDGLKEKGVKALSEYHQHHPEILKDYSSLIAVRAVNRATLDLFEAPTTVAIMQGQRSIFTEESYAVLGKGICALAGGKRLFESELQLKTLKGRTRHLFVRWYVPVGYQTTWSRVLVSMIDITQRKTMEEEILRTRKLESVGLLAGGLAHDFNNLLTAILGNISLAKVYADANDPVTDLLTEAEKGSIRAQGLTQQLLTFSKGGAPLLKTMSLDNVLMESATFALSGSNVKCEVNILPDIWPVEMDEGQISQVINNLIINADQAMPDGGRLRISCENVEIGADSSLSFEEGKYVKISIKDDGVGIPADHIERIFDPYFTTKQKGSGLGLTGAHSIIRKHQGRITVQSALGKGTTFHIYLPASGKAPERTTKAQQSGQLFIGAGRVLVMDDEEPVRKVAGVMLSRLGYEAVYASDGEEAIRCYTEARAQGKPINVVVMDLTVPGGMGGKEAIRKLHDIDPDVTAIVSSGYADDPIMANFGDYGFKAAVSKPYGMQELSETLRKVSGGRKRVGMDAHTQRSELRGPLL